MTVTTFLNYSTTHYYTTTPLHSTSTRVLLYITTAGKFTDTIKNKINLKPTTKKSLPIFTMDATTLDQLAIARDLLLSSPPGQFEVILQDLFQLITPPLPNEWIDKVRTEFHSLTGREALSELATSATMDDDPLGLQEGMKRHIEKYYSARGVKSNYVIDTSSDNAKYSILLYAERIQLEKFHAGSWTARYTITENEKNVVCIKGKAVLRAHSLEHGNVQVKTTVDFPSTEIPKDDIFQKNQNWEESLMNSLGDTYDEISTDALKRFRRVMPVTRTRFDWNLLGHRGIRQLGAEVVQKERGR